VNKNLRIFRGIPIDLMFASCSARHDWVDKRPCGDWLQRRNLKNLWCRRAVDQMGARVTCKD